MPAQLKKMDIKAWVTEKRRSLKEEKKPLGQTIYKLRKAANISQTTLGDLLNLHQTAICRIEQDSQSLSPEELFLISRFFGVSIDSIIIDDINYLEIKNKFIKL